MRYSGLKEEAENMRVKLEDTVALTKEIVHAYYQGNPEPWFRRLCSKSVWATTGERIIAGGEAIREHYAPRLPRKSFRVFAEEYQPIPINARSAAVVVQATVGRPRSETAHIAVSCVLLYQLVAGETKIVLAHVSYGLLRDFKPERDSPLTWVPAYHLFRNLLLDAPETGRLAIPSGGRTFYIHPTAIHYVQSKHRRAELFCVDAVVRNDLTLSQVNALLPEEFCAIHRCYTVNPRYVSSIQRYKVTMVTGDTLPVPAEAYNAVKAELDRRICGWETASR